MRSLWLVIVALLLLLGCGQKPVKPMSFKENIQPILSARCVRCHGPDMARGKIVLSTYANVMSARTSTGKKPLVLPLEPTKSWIYILCATNQPHYRMPPDTATVVALAKEELQQLAKWIEEGAKDN